MRQHRHRQVSLSLPCRFGFLWRRFFSFLFYHDEKLTTDSCSVSISRVDAPHATALTLICCFSSAVSGSAGFTNALKTFVILVFAC